MYPSVSCPSELSLRAVDVSLVPWSASTCAPVEFRVWHESDIVEEGDFFTFLRIPKAVYDVPERKDVSFRLPLSERVYVFPLFSRVEDSPSSQSKPDGCVSWEEGGALLFSLSFLALSLFFSCSLRE